MKKVCVWDGDESLWKGTLIEGQTPEVSDYVRKIVEELYNRGVVQSIASKNRIEDVLEALNNTGLTKYFIVPNADMERSKYDMILNIQQELGISKLSDIVFIDDQQFNREEVWQRSIGDIVVLDPSDVDLEFKLLGGDQLFYKKAYTDEDKNRVEMYRQEQQRKLIENGYSGDKTAFLKSCDIWVKVRKPVMTEMDRVCDLVAKANKLSAASSEYDANKLYRNFGELYICESGDKFGNYGIVGVAHYSPYEHQIKLLVISCRMQGKGIGSAFLGSILQEANELSNGKDISACWKETDYNKGMRSLFEWYDFKPVDTSSEYLLYKTTLSDVSAKIPDWIENTTHETPAAAAPSWSGYEVRFMREEEMVAVCKMASNHKFMKEFPNVWSRWKNWEKNPPVVAVDMKTGAILGFHAATYNVRNPYLNSYYIMVDCDARGKGVGGKMIDFSLQEAHKRGNTRLKMNSHEGGDGEAFWKGFGIKPLLVHDGGVLFDIDITNVSSCTDLVEACKNESTFDVNKIPESQWKRYVKLDPDLEKLKTTNDT